MRIRPRSCALLAALASAALATSPVAAGFIAAGGTVQVLESHPGGLVGSDSRGATSHDGEAISGEAEFGQGRVSFTVEPREGRASMGGVSHPIEFRDFAAYKDESITRGRIDIRDTLHLTGPISGEVHGRVYFLIGGALMPNEEFEEQYEAANGRPTITASAFSSATLNNPGIPGSRMTNFQDYLGTDIDGSFAVIYDATDSARDIELTLTIEAIGLRGGQFVFAGGAGSLSASSVGAAGSGEGSFFHMYVELPRGVGYTADAGYYISPLAVPEPCSLTLCGLGVVLAGAARRRKACT